jgi:hypothetical protein
MNLPSFAFKHPRDWTPAEWAEVACVSTSAEMRRYLFEADRPVEPPYRQYDHWEE